MGVGEGRKRKGGGSIWLGGREGKHLERRMQNNDGDAAGAPDGGKLQRTEEVNAKGTVEKVYHHHERKEDEKEDKK